MTDPFYAMAGLMMDAAAEGATATALMHEECVNLMHVVAAPENRWLLHLLASVDETSVRTAVYAALLGRGIRAEDRTAIEEEVVESLFPASERSEAT